MYATIVLWHCIEFCVLRLCRTCEPGNDLLLEQSVADSVYDSGVP